MGTGAGREGCPVPGDTAGTMTTAPDAPGGRRPPTERVPLPRDIWVLVGASFIIAMGWGIVAPVLPTFARSFDVGVTASSAVVSAFALCRLLFAPAGGWLVTRLGQRRVYLAGLLVVAASSAAAAAAGSYTQLLVLRGLGGVGSTMFTISAMGLIVRLAPPRARGRASSVYGSAFLLGNVGGPLVGSLMAGWGLRVPFLVYAALLVVATIVVAVLLREVPDPARSAPGAAGAPAGPGAGDGPVAAGAVAGGAVVGEGAPPAVPRAEHAPMTVREAWADSAFRAALLAGFANGWTNLGVRIAIVPLLALAVSGEETWSAGAVLTVYAVGNIVALNVAGRGSDRLGRRPFVLAGLLTGGVLTAAIGWVPGLWPLLVLSALAGVATGLTMPALQATIADVIGSDRPAGNVLAAFQMAGDLGGILGPVVAGAIVDRAGYGAAMTVSGGLAVLAGLGWLLARETHAPRRAA